MGLQIDSDLCSAEALLTYRRLVRHYLHHRPLRDAAGKRVIEGRCESCGWVGRAGACKPKCPRCGDRAIPHVPFCLPAG